MSPLIVALVGRSRSGKDTVASTLVSTGRFRLLRMAAPIKAATSALFGIDADAFENASKDSQHPAFCSKTPKSPRDAMVWLTAITKEWLGVDDFFAHRLLETARASEVDVIIPDVRYVADAAMVRKHGGLIVKIRRPVEAGGTTSPWESEVDDIDPDFEIVNDGSLQSLEAAAMAILLRRPTN